MLGSTLADTTDVLQLTAQGIQMPAQVTAQARPAGCKGNIKGTLPVVCCCLSWG
jgi:hypothetical protein